MQLAGIHHLTAITANAPANFAFYTATLGLRLVKRTVNQDDVSAYHLFYADGKASPGSDVTFFDWPVPAERRGTHSIVRTGMRVASEASLAWWRDHLASFSVEHGEIEGRDGRPTLDFEDPEGQRLSLVVDGGLGESHPWAKSAVPTEHQIRGLGPIVMSVPVLYPTDVVVEKVLGMRQVRTYPHPDDARHVVHVYEMGEGGPHAELHVAVQPGLPVVEPGAGGVHHVAFRTPNDDEYEAWAERLNAMGIPNSGEVDRYYFRSLYLREPNGVLFEIATDGPGFAVDEDPATLGEHVVLPPFLESRREAILAGLQPIG